MPLEAQLGTADETTYGTAVTVDHFLEFASEEIVPETQRISNTGLRAGRRTLSADQFIPAVTGYGGSVTLNVLTQGFAFWLEHMLGSVSTSGTGPAYLHTGTIGDNCGKGFTMQVNRPLGACGATDAAHTFSGGKVSKWTLSTEPGEEGVLKLEMDLLFTDGTTSTALATASYPAGMELFAWPSATVSINGTGVPVTSWSVECDRKLKDDRLHLRGNPRRREPVPDDWLEISWTIGVEHDQDWPQVVAEAAADAILTDLVLEVTAPTEITTGVPPKIVVTLPAARVDEGTHTVGGTEIMEADISGMALTPAGGGSPVTIEVTSAESTP